MKIQEMEQLDDWEKALLDELADAEKALEVANDALKKADIKFEMAALKYGGIRDAALEFYGHSPYKDGGRLQWRVRMGDGYKIEQLGKFRFINQAVGQAVTSALQEVDEPQTLDDIVQRLIDGHYHLESTTLKRGVNAALINTKNIVKTDDGKYVWSEE